MSFALAQEDSRAFPNPNSLIPESGLALKPGDEGSDSDDAPVSSGGHGLDRSQHSIAESDQDYFSAEDRPAPPSTDADALLQAAAQADRQLLLRLLDLERPIISASMVEFLLKDGVCDMLGSFIARPARPSAEVAFVQPFPPDFAHRVRAWDNDDAMRRSYRAMGLLVSPSKALTKLLEARLTEIVLSLARIFEPEADGNFAHYAQAMKQLLVMFPGEVHALIVDHGLLGRMMHFLHDCSVSQTVLLVLLQRSGAQQRVYDALSAPGLLGLLTSKATGRDTPLDIAPACDFVMRLTADLAAEEISEMFWCSLAKAPLVDAVAHMVVRESEGAAAAGSEAHAELVRLLVELLSGSRRMLQPSPFEPLLPPPPNRMTCMLHHVVMALRKHVPALVSAFCTLPESAELRMGKYVVTHRLQPAHLDYMRLFVDLAETIPELVLPSLSAALWQRTFALCTAHAHSNILHDLVRRLFYAVLGCDAQRDDALRLMLVDARLIDVLADHYMGDVAAGRASGFIGHVILFANLLRLRAEVEPAGAFLPSFLDGSAKWQAFVPVLRDVTQLQASWPYTHTPRLAPMYPGPQAAALPPSASLDDVGIDADSNYARMLAKPIGVAKR